MKKKVIKGFILTFVLTAIVILLNVNFSNAAKINAKNIEIEAGLNRLMRIEGIKNVKKVKWSSRNKKIATVSKTGRVKGKKKGETRITARVNGKKYICNVKVLPKMTDVQRVEKLLKDYGYEEKIDYTDDSCFLWNAKKTKLLGIKIDGANFEEDALVGENKEEFVQLFIKSKYLDLSGFKSLKMIELHCFSIEEINLNGLTKLKKLKMKAFEPNDDVKFIDFYGVKGMEKLIVSSDQLKSIPYNVLKSLKYAEVYGKIADRINLYYLKSAKHLEFSFEASKKISFPNLSKLETLNIYGEKKLAEVNISKLKNLKFFNCRSNSTLKKLTIGNLVKLKRLDCYGNGLTYLDLSGAINLEEIYCRHNKLTELDVRGFTSLVFVECDSDVNIIRN